MRTVGAKIFECDVPMQAVILSGGIHPAIESRVSELGTSWFSEYKVVSHGDSFDSEYLLGSTRLWNLINDLGRSPAHADIWGLSILTGEWRKVAEFVTDLEFPLVIEFDLLCTPEFRDLLFAYQVTVYASIYGQCLYMPPDYQEAYDYIHNMMVALHENRGVVSPGSCIPGLFGRYLDKDCNIVGGSLARPKLVPLTFP